MPDQPGRPKRGYSFTIGLEDLIALDGYRGDGVCRILRVKELDATHLKGECVLRSSPTEPVFRSYLIEKIDGLRRVVGQVKTVD
jgi:hypothetical protein